MKSRSELSISGICDIISSDENTVHLDTVDGALEIEGSELHIISMNVANGSIIIEGKIDTISYHDKTQLQKNSFFARMFK